MERIEAEHPRPRHFLLHLSDPHLLGGPDPLHGVVDSEALLMQLFDEVQASGARPEAVIFTGDLADQGEPEAYAKLRAIVEPACEDLGAKVIWAMGNHDNRANFRTGLLDQAGNDAPVDHSYFVNGLRVITLDTSVPGLPPRRGEPRPAGLARRASWPPRPRTAPSWPCTTRRCRRVLDLAVLVELRDQAAPGRRRLRNSDVRAILAGHLHYSTTATFAGIPVSVASATCYTQDLNVPVGGTRGRDGGAGVQPGARLRAHGRALRGAAGRAPRRWASTSPRRKPQRRLAAAGIRIPEKAKRRGPATDVGSAARVHRHLSWQVAAATLAAAGSWLVPVRYFSQGALIGKYFSRKSVTSSARSSAGTSGKLPSLRQKKSMFRLASSLGR